MGVPRPIELGLGNRRDESHKPLVLFTGNTQANTPTQTPFRTVFFRQTYLPANEIFCDTISRVDRHVESTRDQLPFSCGHASGYYQACLRVGSMHRPPRTTSTLRSKDLYVCITRLRFARACPPPAELAQGSTCNKRAKQMEGTVCSRFGATCDLQMPRANWSRKNHGRASRDVVRRKTTSGTNLVKRIKALFHTIAALVKTSTHYHANVVRTSFLLYWPYECCLTPSWCAQQKIQESK